MKEEKMHRIFGLVGKNISYSFSPGFFKTKFEKENIKDAEYQLFDMAAIDQIRTVFDHPNLVGFNVTIPYKEEIIPYLDELNPLAQEVGAVNTVKIRDGKKIGYNTDVIGFQQSLINNASQLPHKAIVLGTGGASKAVQVALKGLEIDFRIVSRRQKENVLVYEDLNEELMQAYYLIINTTPLGTSPNMEIAPAIPYQFLGKQHILFDLIYNPEKTKFLRNGEQHGTQIINGLEMLQIQAKAAWEIWNGY